MECACSVSTLTRLRQLPNTLSSAPPQLQATAVFMLAGKPPYASLIPFLHGMKAASLQHLTGIILRARLA